MIPSGPASHTHDNMDHQRDREIRLVQARDEALREVERLRPYQRKYLRAVNDKIGVEAALAAIDALHQPDPDGHACQCGLSMPCPTRRALDGGTT